MFNTSVVMFSISPCLAFAYVQCVLLCSAFSHVRLLQLTSRTPMLLLSICFTSAVLHSICSNDNALRTMWPHFKCLLCNSLHEVHFVDMSLHASVSDFVEIRKRAFCVCIVWPRGAQKVNRFMPPKKKKYKTKITMIIVRRISRN